MRADSYYRRAKKMADADGRPEIVDLFCGAGGFSLGGHLAGFSTVLAIDNDRDLTSTFKVNFPEARLLQMDLRRLKPLKALARVGRQPEEVAGVVGGPPCQGFSCIGRRNKRDSRNRLLGRFFGFVSEAKPAFFVFENVPGLLEPGNRDLLDRELESVSQDFDFIGPFVVDASDFGVPTLRSRVIVVGYRPGRLKDISESKLLKSGSRLATVREAIMDLPRPENGSEWLKYSSEPAKGRKGAFARRARKLPLRGLSTTAIREKTRKELVSGCQVTVHTRAVLRRFSALDMGAVDEISRYPRLVWDEPAPTLRAGTGRDRGSYQAARPIHPTQPRVITVREAARIQGFPDWFQFHTTKWHSFRMIGNSVSPPVARTILKAIREHLVDSEGSSKVPQGTISAKTG